MTTPAGTFACWLYTVRRPNAVTKAYFAKALPGPPVLMVQAEGEAEVFRMTLVEQKSP